MGCLDRLILFTPAILAATALLLGSAGNLYCQTMEIPHVNSNSTANGVVYAGVWSYRTKDIVGASGSQDQMWIINTCRNYIFLKRDLGFHYELDGKARATMVFSLLVLFFGGLGVFFALVASLFARMPEKRWKLFGNVFLFTCFLQAMTLLMHSSSLCLDNPVLQLMESESPNMRDSFIDGCKLGAGYRLSIVSVVIWLGAGLFTYMFKPPQISRSEPPQRQTVTYQRNPDGAVVETNVVVVKGTAVQEEQHPALDIVEDEEKK